MHEDPSDATLRDWLLGKLATAESEPLEERLLAERGFAERVRAAETDLLDDLARARLDAPDRAAARRLFAADARDRERLRIARALAALTAAGAHGGAATPTPDAIRANGPHRRPDAARAASGRRRSRRRAGVIAALAAVCLAVAVVGLRRQAPWRTPGDAAGVEAPAATATIALLAATSRAAGRIEDVVVPAAAATVRVQAEIDGGDAPAGYDLRVESGTKTRFEARNVPVRTAGGYRYVEAIVPAPALAGGPVVVALASAGATSPSQRWTIRVRVD